MVVAIQEWKGELVQQALRNNKDQNKTIEMGEAFWNPKWKRKQMEVEVKDSMHPIRRTNEEKEIEQLYIRVWDIGKFSSDNIGETTT